MSRTDSIIILNKTPFGEKSAVAHCLSEEKGRCSFMVHSLCRNGAFLQPLSIIEASVSAHPKSSLETISQLCELYPLRGIRQSAGKSAISMFMAEVLFRALKEGFCDKSFFQWCVRQVLLLDSLQTDYSNFHVRFMLEFISMLGYRPSFEDLLPFLDAEGIQGGAGSPGGGSITGGGSIAAATRRILELPFAEAMLVPLSGALRGKICSCLLRYLEFHLEYPVRVRSLGVLSELF